MENLSREFRILLRPSATSSSAHHFPALYCCVSFVKITEVAEKATEDIENALSSGFKRLRNREEPRTLN
jgi:hypothetical protein